MAGLNHRLPACKAGALPAELIALKQVEVIINTFFRQSVIEDRPTLPLQVTSIISGIFIIYNAKALEREVRVYNVYGGGMGRYDGA